MGTDNLQTLYMLVGRARSYKPGDIVVCEVSAGDFWIGEVWRETFDQNVVPIKYGVYGSGEARNLVRKEYVRPATNEEVLQYKQRQEKRGR